MPEPPVSLVASASLASPCWSHARLILEAWLLGLEREAWRPAGGQGQVCELSMGTDLPLVEVAGECRHLRQTRPHSKYEPS